jgi:hypothetical protein
MVGKIGCTSRLTILLFISYSAEIPGAVLVESQRDSSSPFPARVLTDSPNLNTKTFWPASSSGSPASIENGHLESIKLRQTPWIGEANILNGNVTASLIPNPSKFDREAARRSLFQSLHVTPEQRMALAQLAQGSVEWIEARKNRCALPTSL